MKQKLVLIVKKYRLLICVAAFVLCFAITGSYAAYVESNSAKKVVSAGSLSQTLFSSNYLYLMDISDDNYSYRRITPTLNQEKSGYTFTVQICNYVYGRKDLVNESDISYKLMVTLLSADGKELPAGYENISMEYTLKESTGSVTFSGGTTVYKDSVMQGINPCTDSYTFFVPKEIKDSVRIQIVAKPESGSYQAVNNKKLGVILSMTELNVVEGWSGRFLDDQTVAPGLYDGFNYEISGNGEGVLTLSWDPNVLEISPWFCEIDVKDALISNSATTGSVSFKVGGENQPKTFQLQFYKANKNCLENLSWEDMITKKVQVSFQKNTENHTKNNENEN